MRYIICFLLLVLFSISPLTNGAVVPSEGLYTGQLTLTCSDPGTPSYGYRKGYDFGIGSTVSFSCYEGFVLIGSNTLTCQAKEKRTSTVITWSDHTPVCVEDHKYTSKCSTKGPKAPKPGRHAVKLRSDMKTVLAFACSSYKYRPESGDRVVGCIDKEWHGTPLECRRKAECSVGTLSPHTYLLLTGTLEGDTGRFTCSKGYRLPSGASDVISCTSTGDWSTTWPSCHVVDCGVPPSIFKGVPHYSSTVYQSVVNYTCPTGYRTIGRSAITCQSNGEWETVRVRCEIKTCPRPVRPGNGRVYYNNTQFNSTARYTCNTGYMRNGAQYRTCGEDSQWYPARPYCEVVNCFSPPPLRNGSVTVTTTTVKSVATYYCKEGFELVGGNPQITCQINGKWSDNQLNCIADCGPLVSGPNSRLIHVLDKTTVGAVAKYYCIPGYFMLGSGTRYCREDGTWSPLEHQCQPVNCGPPPRLENGVVIYGNTTLAHSARYRCNTGFNLTGLQLRVCTINGKWSGSTPTCKIIDCGKPPVILNGNVSFTATTFTSIATYTCGLGYRLNGSDKSFCIDNGTWTRPTPTCNRITSCPDPGVPTNSRRLTIPTALSSFPIGSIVYHICTDGFDGNGSSARECMVNGEWSGEPLTCTLRNLTCVGSGRMKDPVGRLCNCSNETLVDCHRYREDWLNLSDQEREDYITAVKRVSSDPLYQPLYRNLMIKYRNTSRTLSQSLEPSRTHFLPWHRYYLHQYEDMLRLVDPNLFIPYWDWTLLSKTPYRSPVFNSSDQGFGNSSDPESKCVNEGPFRKGKFLIVSRGNRKCLRREYGGATPLLSRPELEDVILAQPASAFSRFFRFLTIPFLTVRCSIGGTMCDINEATPTNDPLYLLILSFLDNVWYRWQSISKEHTISRYGTNSALLLLTEPYQFTVQQYNNANQLPYSTSVEYGEPVDTITRGKRGLAATSINRDLVDHSVGEDGPGLIHVCPLEEEWLERLQLNNEETALVKSLCRLLYNMEQ